MSLNWNEIKHRVKTKVKEPRKAKVAYVSA
jgi:hypothetical protein